MSGFGCRVSGFGFQVSDFGFRVLGFGSGDSGFGFRVERFSGPAAIAEEEERIALGAEVLLPRHEPLPPAPLCRLVLSVN